LPTYRLYNLLNEVRSLFRIWSTCAISS